VNEDLHHVRLKFVGISATFVCMVTDMHRVEDIHEGIWPIVNGESQDGDTVERVCFINRIMTKTQREARTYPCS